MVFVFELQVLSLLKHVHSLQGAEGSIENISTSSFLAEKSCFEYIYFIYIPQIVFDMLLLLPFCENSSYLPTK